VEAQVRILGGSVAPAAHTAEAARADTSAGHESEGEPVDDKPKSVYELVTRQMLEQVKADVNEVKGRINTLLWLVIGAILMEFVMRVVK
jgi:hypothetical protein